MDPCVALLQHHGMSSLTFDPGIWGAQPPCLDWSWVLTCTGALECLTTKG